LFVLLTHEGAGDGLMTRGAGMAALSWLLNRKLRLDPAREEFIGDDEANGLRSLPERSVL
jgi:hypothetical protein